MPAGTSIGGPEVTRITSGPPRLGNGAPALREVDGEAITANAELIRVNSVKGQACAYRSRVSEDVIANIRARVDKCRKLADMITDERAAAILRQMAEDGETDIKRLQAEQESGRERA